MKNKNAYVIAGCLIWLLLAIVFIIGIIAVIKASVNALFAKQEIHTEEYVVSVDETLWDIACENTDGNVGEYVYNLRKLNNIDNCIIYPGQVIKIIK